MCALPLPPLCALPFPPVCALCALPFPPVCALCALPFPPVCALCALPFPPVCALPFPPVCALVAKVGQDQNSLVGVSCQSCAGVHSPLRVCETEFCQKVVLFFWFSVNGSWVSLDAQLQVGMKTKAGTECGLKNMRWMPLMVAESANCSVKHCVYGDHNKLV